MKKILKALGLVLIGFILGIVVAPKGDNSTETVKEVVKSEETNKTETKSNESPKKETTKPVQKAPTQVFEDDRVKISFVKLETNGVKFLVENKTSTNITIQADSVSINGFSSNKIMMSDDVAPNSKGFVMAQTSELNDVGSPEKVSGNLRVIDFKDSFKTYDASFTDVVVQ
ncbi:hypothetical protein AB1I92_28100 [Bacillus mobilis]|uniref:Uncharacterized protein n=2 Tax=Bacillus cereus group TaxID=86661 RepID=A0A1C4FAL7_BACCE|nr:MULTISPECIES: hypothetical protein [Bacillus cereus group]OKA35027.1 hypothetical protein BJR06_18920 [Bacillus cereus]OKA38717.1 hypothetical protein BJR07_12450 [Bacillus cereus]SCC52683.1 Protein of unknown function [Bacillus mobilis]